MNVWVVTKDGVPLPNVYVSLLDACEEAGVSYRSATEAGKRVWVNGNSVIRLYRTLVVRAEGKIRKKKAKAGTHPGVSAFETPSPYKR